MDVFRRVSVAHVVHQAANSDSVTKGVGLDPFPDRQAELTV